MVVGRGFSWLMICLSSCLWLVGCSQVIQPTTQLNQLDVPAQPVLHTTAGELWLTDEAGKQAQVITTQPGQVQAVTWLHDASALVYVVQVGEYFQLWELPVDQTVQEKLLFATHVLPEQMVVSPNNQWLTYFEGTNAFVVDLATGDRRRVYEDATGLAWSPTSRQFIVTTTDQRVLSYQYNVHSVLGDPTVVAAPVMQAPVFLNDHTIIFEGQVDSQFAIESFDLTTQITTPASSLRFSTSDATVRLTLSPDKKQLLYSRVDGVWVIDLSSGTPKRILSNAQGLAWTSDSRTVWYEFLPEQAIYQATSAGLNKTELFSNTTTLSTTL